MPFFARCTPFTIFTPIFLRLSILMLPLWFFSIFGRGNEWFARQLLRSGYWRFIGRLSVSVLFLGFGCICSPFTLLALIIITPAPVSQFLLKYRMTQYLASLISISNFYTKTYNDGNVFCAILISFNESNSWANVFLQSDSIATLCFFFYIKLNWCLFHPVHFLEMWGGHRGCLHKFSIIVVSTLLHYQPMCIYAAYILSLFAHWWLDYVCVHIVCIMVVVVVGCRPSLLSSADPISVQLSVHIFVSILWCGHMEFGILF